MDTNQKKIAVLTSGGDSPGMNAGIRAVVRKCLFHGHEAYGVARGYKGLVDNDLNMMTSSSVSNIIQKGGTILKSSRCLEMKTVKGLLQAKENLIKNNIDALIAIGGNGTYTGAVELSKVWEGKVVGVPGTIDNDIYGTDSTIGYDTAVNTAMEAIDKIRDTAESHERFFLVEVMGRHAGFIALDVGISGGAEEVLIPETVTDLDAICKKLHENKNKGKYSNIVVVCEGDEVGGALTVSQKLKEISGQDNRVVILGHMQRGGRPSAADRILASQLGSHAVELALKGESAVAVGSNGRELTKTPLLDAISKKKEIEPFMLGLIGQLSG